MDCPCKVHLNKYIDEVAVVENWLLPIDAHNKRFVHMIEKELIKSIMLIIHTLYVWLKV